MPKALVGRILSPITLLLGILTSLAWPLRLRVLWVWLLRTLAEIPLRLNPRLYDAQDEHKREYASGTVRSRRQRDQFCKALQQAEAEGVSPAEAALRAGIDPGQQRQLSDQAHGAFEGIPAHVKEAAVQYSGGADSTLAAVLAAHRFERVHLLSFYHPFIRQKEKTEVNARKLAQIFGDDAIVYCCIDATEALNSIMFGDYLRDLRKYGTVPVGDACLACKLSFDVEIIRYALDNDVGLVVDGADLRVPFQLSQGHEGMLELRRQFYLEYGIDFRHPVVAFDDTTTELFLFGLQSDPPCLVYPDQPHCVGNDFLGAVYKRFYFLPKYGMEGLDRFADEWAREKLAVCRQLLSPPSEAKSHYSVPDFFRRRLRGR